MIPVGKMSWREISAMLGSCCSSMLFGLSFMFTKRIVGTVPAFSLLSWRFLMGAAAMSLCALLGVIHIDYKTKKPWPLLRMTLYLPAAYFIFETYGIELTSASESGTIIACIPIFTVLASALFLHEMPSKFQVGGVLLSTAGIVIITLLKGTSPTFNPLGYVLLFGAVFSDVIYFIHNRQLTAYTPVEKTYFMCLTGAVFFTVCALVYNGVHGTVTEYLTLPFTSGSFLTSCLYLGIGCTTLAFLLTNRSVTIIGPTRTSAFSGLTTVISVVSGVVFLHEPFSLLQGLATALVLAGIYCVNILHSIYTARRQAAAEQKGANRMNELLRAIPKVTELYDLPEVSDLREHYAPSSVTEWIRTVLEQLRSAILSGEVTTLPTLEELGDRICRVAARESLPSLRPVINATGVILHTNLGRGCLSDRAADAVYDIARGYSTLEYNVEAGHRGSRHDHVEKLLCRLTGAESAMVVNNNAAAVMLILSTLAQGARSSPPAGSWWRSAVPSGCRISWSCAAAISGR